MQKIVVGVLMALVGFASAIAPAQDACAQTPQTIGISELSLQVTKEMFAAFDVRAAFRKGVEDGATPTNAFIRPEWMPALKEILIDQFGHEQELFDVMVAREVAKNFSINELQAGAVILGDPAIVAGAKAASQGRPPPPALRPSPQADRMLRSPEGVAFLKKVQGLEGMLQPIQQEFILALMPSVLRRLGERTETLEAQRRQAERLPQTSR